MTTVDEPAKDTGAVLTTVTIHLTHLVCRVCGDLGLRPIELDTTNREASRVAFRHLRSKAHANAVRTVAAEVAWLEDLWVRS